ncbi:MAG: hypothetical protein WCK48_02045 [bacterium]
MKDSYIPKIIIIVVFIGLIIGISFSTQKKNKNPEQVNSLDTSVSTSTSTATPTFKTSGGQITIKQVPSGGTTVSGPIPDLTRAVQFTTELTPEVKDLIVKKIADLQSSLKTNPANLSGWIDLGLYQKTAGDYAGAVESWKYATKIVPESFVAYGNLGNLYGYYLKDNALAEIYYKEAIQKGPTQSYLYTQLAQMYLDTFGDTAKAKATIEEGLTKIPNNPSLLEFKSRLN